MTGAPTKIIIKDTDDGMILPQKTTSPKMNSDSTKIGESLGVGHSAQIQSRALRRESKQSPQFDLYEGPFDVESADLELMEKRIEEMEKYLGIENMDLAYFKSQEGEDLNKKSQMLEDFMMAAQESYSCINEIFARFEKLDHFLKHDKPFINQCMDLKQKTNFIVDWLDDLNRFISDLETIKQKESHLTFDPITGKFDLILEVSDPSFPCN